MASTEWHTPQWITEPLSEAVDGFDLDPASGCEPEPIADARYTKEDDGLSLPWFGNVFVNPPYSRKDNPRWAEKIHAEAQEDRTDIIIALVPANTSTNWWHDHYAHADKICLVDERIKFGGADNTGKFANAFCVWGDEIPEGVVEFLEAQGSLYETTEALGPGKYHVGDQLQVELGNGVLGFPKHVDESATVEVQCARLTDDGYVEVCGVQPRTPPDGPEVYYLLSAPLTDLTDIRCSVAPDGRDWQTVPLSSVELATRETVTVEGTDVPATAKAIGYVA